MQDEHGLQEKWWQEVTAMIQRRPQPRAELVALIDASGRVGSLHLRRLGPSSRKRRMLGERAGGTA